MELEQLRLYLAVVEEKSFNKAADTLGLPRRTLRRHVDALEAELGTPLLVRGAAGTIPTDRGLELASGAADLLRRAASLHQGQPLDELVGEIRVSYPAGMPPDAAAAFVSTLTGERPGVFVNGRTYSEFDAGNPPDADLIMLLMLGPPPAGAYRSYLLGHIPERLLAHPSYLERSGRPRSVGDLRHHQLLTWRPPGEDGRVWTDRSGGRTEQRPIMIVDDIGGVRRAAAGGLGIARVPDGGPSPGEEALVEVLPEHFGRELSLRVLVPRGAPRAGQTNVVAEILRKVSARWVEEAAGRRS